MTDVLHLVAPASVGGLEAVVEALAAGQQEHGWSVEVATIVEPSETPHPVAQCLTRRNLTVEVLEVPPRSYLVEARSIRALLERKNPSLVHTHGYRCDVLGAWVARRSGYPVVSTVHGFTGGSWKNRLYEHIQRQALRFMNAVVAVSSQLARDLRAAGISAEKLHVIPNAWEQTHPLLPRNEARAHLGIGSDEMVIGWVGRLSPEKGPDLFLRALKLLLPQHALTASIIGKGSDECRLRRLAGKLGIRDRIRFHGEFRGAARLFRALDLFVLSSRTEGMPIVLFEAMAAGVPIVATRVGGVPEVLSEREAILVPPDDPAALAKGMQKVLANPAASRERAMRAVRRLHDLYSVGPWLESYLSIYRSVANGPWEA